MRIRKRFLLLIAVLVNTAAAQLTIDWWTVNGGGGTGASADGRFVVSGTAGQPDAGLMAGGAFFLEGGFWNGRLLPIPSLWIVLLPNGDIEVCWPLWAEDYHLEQNTTLAGPPESWKDVPLAIYQADATRRYITVSAPSACQYYRLHGTYPGS